MGRKMMRSENIGRYRVIAEHYRDLLINSLLILQFVPLLTAALTGRLDEYSNLTDPSAINDASASVVWEIVALFLFVNSVAAAHILRVPLRAAVFAALPLALMLVWMLLSIEWSAYPLLSIRRVLRAIVELATIILLATSLESGTALMRVLFRPFLFICVADIASLAVPRLSLTDIGFAGVHLHKNLAGLFFFTALPVFAFGIMNRSVSRFRFVAIGAFVAASGMLMLTLSKSAIGVACISAIFVLLSRLAASPSAYSRIILPLCCALFFGCSAMLVLDFGIRETIDFLFGDASLTGRDQIWRYVLYIFQKDPLRGVGYGALWQVGPDVETTLKNTGTTWIPNEGHNGYIDVLGQLGWIGLALLIIFLMMTFVRIYRYFYIFEKGQVLGAAGYGIYVFWGAIIYNITESSFFRSGHGLWLMLVLVSAFAAGRLRGHRAGQRIFVPRGASAASETAT
jgi:exopolysaccharide production protein ExoQ